MTADTHEMPATIDGKPQWEFCCEWYRFEEIARSLSRKPPPGSNTQEFPEWITHQYRLAMNKGMDLMKDQLKRDLADARAEIERLKFDLKDSQDVADASIENEKRLQRHLASRSRDLDEAVGLLRKLQFNFDSAACYCEIEKFLSRLDAERTQPDADKTNPKE